MCWPCLTHIRFPKFTLKSRFDKIYKYFILNFRQFRLLYAPLLPHAATFLRNPVQITVTGQQYAPFLTGLCVSQFSLISVISVAGSADSTLSFCHFTLLRSQLFQYPLKCIYADLRMAVGRVRVGDPRVLDPSGPGSGTIFSPRVFGFGGPIWSGFGAGFYTPHGFPHGPHKIAGKALGRGPTSRSSPEPPTRPS
jgi:hypothetical protein